MTTTAPATLSIQKDPGYSALRICAQTCVDKGNNNSDLEGELECGDSKILNACFCREDLRPKATTFLSSCIISRCGYNNPDVTSALKLYDGYCSFKPLTPTTVSATTTGVSTTRVETTATTKSLTSRFSTPASSTSQFPTLSGSSATSSSSTFASQTSSIALPASTADGSSITSNRGGDGASISTGAIAGIVIGGIIALVLGLGLLMWIHRRGRRSGGMGSNSPHGDHEDDRLWQVLNKSEVIRLEDSPSMSAATATVEEAQVQWHDAPAAVEICDTGFRAELSAGEDLQVRYPKEKT